MKDGGGEGRRVEERRGERGEMRRTIEMDAEKHKISCRIPARLHLD